MERRKADFPGELLIVMALLLTMAATAIPNLLRAAIADQESLAASPSPTPGTTGISARSPSPRH
jgi:hypothetical protein